MEITLAWLVAMACEVASRAGCVVRRYGEAARARLSNPLKWCRPMLLRFARVPGENNKEKKGKEIWLMVM